MSNQLWSGNTSILGFRRIREKSMFYRVKRGNIDNTSVCSNYSIKVEFLEVGIGGTSHL